jgi:hypothetical protein
MPVTREDVARLRENDPRTPLSDQPPVLSDASRRQIVDGRSFVLDAPDHVPAIFGHDREVIWPEGEGLLICGPQGVGKTTLQQQLALRRAGVLDGELIGFPVEPDEKLTLYLALDRPRQISRSFKRMVTYAQEQQLGRLVVWKGPLPFNLVKTPETFVLFVQEIAAIIGTPIGTVCADSLKDMASPLSSDEVGAAINRALGGLIALEIEVSASHHQRKATSENKKPTGLADVYGSMWITAGAGSVLLLWGDPGDPIVEMTHLKQPADEVGPLELAHDHECGITTRRDRPDAWAILQGATRGGTTALDVAEAIYAMKPNRAQVEKARRKLEKFTEKGYATRIDPKQKGEPTVYRPVADVSLRDSSRDPLTQVSRSSRNPGNTSHAPITPPTESRPPLSEWGERDVDGHPQNGRSDAELQALIDSEREVG